MSTNKRVVTQPGLANTTTANTSSGQTHTSEARWRSYGIGVDCHSRFVTVTVCIPNFVAGTQKMHRKNFPATAASLRQAREWILQLIVPVAPTTHSSFHYTLESSATYHLPVVLAWQGSPSIINPNLAKLGSRQTDNIDSLSLAEQDLQGRWALSYLHTPSLTALRVKLRERQRWLSFASSLAKCISTGLNKFGHTFQVLGPIRSTKVRPIVEDYLSGRKLFTQEGRDSTSPIPVPQHLRELWCGYLEQIDLFEGKATHLQNEIRELLLFENFWTSKGDSPATTLLEHLDTIPGIGAITAMSWLIETGDLRRFPNCKACVAWSGFDPSLKVSAGKVVAHSNRRGHKVLHHLFCEPAGSVLRRGDTALGVWGQTIRNKHKKGGWQKAVGAVGRRLIQGCYYVTSRCESWAPHSSVKEANDGEEETRG